MGERVSMGEQPYQVIAGLVAGTCLIWSLGEVLVWGGGIHIQLSRMRMPQARPSCLEVQLRVDLGRGAFPGWGHSCPGRPKASSHNLT